MSTKGRFYDGSSWTDVTTTNDEGSFRGSQRPLPPILDGDGNIFVSIASFRDGKRCGQTLVELFENARNPDKIIVGLVEQNSEDANDPFCLEVYCQLVANINIYKRTPIRKDTIKIVAKQPERFTECPRIQQIRKLAVHNIAAKGPAWARSLGRKLLGDEEFCLQIDAHTKFVKDWDIKLLEEWQATENEFAIISHPLRGYQEYDQSELIKVVPRHCSIDFLEVQIPQYALRGDGKVENLQVPLLAHTWTPGFSFAKCHLEESAPYDGLSPYVADVEGFARYARFWTRGYDVYTPTQNIVYHNFQPHPDGHGTMEWMKPRRQRLRDKSLRRIRSYLELPDGTEDGLKLGNIGIYGLGKRRTLKQLNDFVGIDLQKQQPRPPTLSCGNLQWVPYDANISPVENLYSNPDDLDPQPEYPLRTKFTFYKEIEAAIPDLEVLAGDLHPTDNQKYVGGDLSPPLPAPRFPSITLMLILWIFGLIAWCYYVVAANKALSKGKRKRKKIAATNNNFKDK